MMDAPPAIFSLSSVCISPSGPVTTLTIKGRGLDRPNLELIFR